MKKFSTAISLCILIFFQIPFGINGIRIGGLFDESEEDQEWAFRYAVDAINENRDILPYQQLIAHTERVPKDDSFAVSKATCRLLKAGAIGIFGPTAGVTSHHVQSTCDTKEVPHIEMSIDPGQGRGNCLLNVYPEVVALSNVYVSLVKAWGWDSFTILYENTNSLPRVSELIKMHHSKGHSIVMRQLDNGIGDNYRAVLHRVKLSGETRFVLDCSIDKLKIVLMQAQQIGIMSDGHTYIITNPDMHTIDMEPFKYGGANITGVRLLDPDDPYVVDTVAKWASWDEARGKAPEDYFNRETLRSDAALTHDAVYAFAYGLAELDTSKFLHETIDCEGEEAWEHGFTVINYMKTNYVKGLTRVIKFDHEGYRSDFLIDIIELTNAGMTKVGTWNSSEGLNFTRISQSAQAPMEDGSLVNRTFIVLTALSAPYGMLKEASEKLEGNDRFEGYGIELIDKIAKMLSFNYTFVLQEDGVYGSLDKKTGKWNGMVQQLLDWKADLAITDLTITADRESAVDFTMPFMNLGIAIVYKKPSKQPPSLFSFMSPFSSMVWLCVGSAYLGVSVLLFISGRLAPQEWQNPYPCIEEPDTLENQFSLPNSLWFTVGAVLQQGTEIAPIAISTRMIAGIWWFFTLIMVSSYTANLAAFLTVESLYSPINNAGDLAVNDVGIMYGAKRDGSTLSFFKDADMPTYKIMYEYMMAHPEALMSSNDAGIQRVKDENYAFLMESSSIQYKTQRECDITQIGGLLDDKGYGIAMRKNSAYRNTLSAAVLKLQEDGTLTKMYMKWWEEKRGGGACNNAAPAESSLSLSLANVGGIFVVLFGGCLCAAISSVVDLSWEVKSVASRAKEDTGDAATEELGVDNVGGVFVVLVGGCFLAIFIATHEMFSGVRKRVSKYKVPFREELMEELRFVGKCSGATKPVRHRPRESESTRNSGEGSANSIHASAKSEEAIKPFGFGLKIPKDNGN